MWAPNRQKGLNRISIHGFSAPKLRVTPSKVKRTNTYSHCNIYAVENALYFAFRPKTLAIFWDSTSKMYF